ncbi:MAG: hypothetical protein AAF267_01355 [Deinococcota bacterium]
MTITPGVTYREKEGNQLYTVTGTCWIRQGNHYIGGVLYEPRVVGESPLRRDTYACTTYEFSQVFEPWAGER